MPDSCIRVKCGRDNDQAQRPPLGTCSGYNRRVETFPNRPTSQRGGAYAAALWLSLKCILDSIAYFSCRDVIPTYHRFWLLVGYRSTGWAGEVDDFEAFEADLATPPPEVCTGIIKGVAEFDEHIERHQQTLDVLAAGVVNQRFDGYQRAARTSRGC